MPITGWTTLACAALLLGMTIIVIRLRRGLKVPHGDGGQKVLEKAIRGQANATEQMPMALIVMGLAEMNNAPGWLLLPGALALIAGRAAHAAYFMRHGLHWRWRITGMSLTLAAQGLLLLALCIGLIF